MDAVAPFGLRLGFRVSGERRRLRTKHLSGLDRRCGGAGQNPASQKRIRALARPIQEGAGSRPVVWRLGRGAEIPGRPTSGIPRMEGSESERPIKARGCRAWFPMWPSGALRAQIDGSLAGHFLRLGPPWLELDGGLARSRSVMSKGNAPSRRWSCGGAGSSWCGRAWRPGSRVPCPCQISASAARASADLRGSCAGSRPPPRRRPT